MRDLRNGVVGILGSDQSIVGTGLVANAQLILTCAHVVEQAGSRPGQTVLVRFHHGGQ